jgi:hypothetical protein
MSEYSCGLLEGHDTHLKVLYSGVATQIGALQQQLVRTQRTLRCNTATTATTAAAAAAASGGCGSLCEPVAVRIVGAYWPVRLSQTVRTLHLYPYFIVEALYYRGRRGCSSCPHLNTMGELCLLLVR